ncbi:uracil-DNA glycosylase family protein [Aestuariivirga sp.]|uniref:uracil-DNA glycosylase family protein n=1 Tax=Aestuariivirga sp. TaxID=2650926 RepID=UPI0039E3EC21
MAKSPALKTLLTNIARCRICVEKPRGKPLPHEPRPVLRPSKTARILIAGQAPGTRVHASGAPFTDPSGDRLRNWLNVSSEQFYDNSRIAIVPMGFCFPGLTADGADLPPRPECAAHWRASLMAAMPQIDLIILLGSHAMRWHMGKDWAGKVDDTVRNWRQGLARTPMLFPLPHPSWRNSGWLKRNPWFEAELLPVLRAEVALRM